MFKSYLAVSVAVGLILFAGQALAIVGPPTFTGDVPNDFMGVGQFYLDPDGGLDDVGLPPGITSSGCAIIQLAVAYDTMTDTLYVGIDTVGIALDVDGDGDPGNTCSKLKRLGGKDFASGALAESFTFSLDLDNDGFLDVIAGIDLNGTMTGGYMVRAFNGEPSMPYFAFGADIGLGGSMNHDPSASMPDLEFTITGLKGIDPDFDGTEDIHMHAFVGSIGDDGIGEDYLEVFAIPEPATIMLVGGALALLAGIVRKRIA